MVFSWTTIHAQPYISSDIPPSCYEIEARVRNGYDQYEAVLSTPSTPSLLLPGGSKWQLNPSGLPIWNKNGNKYGDIHSFRFTYILSTGTSVWEIDFNRDGDFTDLNESVTNTAPTIADRGFQYIGVLVQGNVYGKTASLLNFTINGVDFGSFTSSTNTPFKILFEDGSGLFNDLVITGNFSFSGHGNSERPRIWVRLGESNTAPECTLTSPVNGAIYNLGSPITLSAKVSDNTGSIVRVEFYDGDNKIGEDPSSPYVMNWDAPSYGNRILRAKAIDSHEAMTFSNPVFIRVKGPPGLNILNPQDGFIFRDPDTIRIDAEITDVLDSFNLVEFFLDNMIIGNDNVPPFTNSSLVNIPMGTYSLKAKSTDSGGAMLLSQQVQINVRCIIEDLNDDGLVSTFDFLILLAAFGSDCSNGCRPDFNDDKEVDTNDFLRLLSKFKHKCN